MQAITKNEIYFEIFIPGYFTQTAFLSIQGIY